MFGVAFNVRFFVNALMKQWNTELTASNQRLGNVKIRRGIFQGDSLSPLLFVEVHSLEKYLSTSKEKILQEVSRSRIIQNNKYRRSKEQIHKEHREKYEGKPIHGQFIGSKKLKSWDWLKKGYLKRDTESTIVVAQEQALCTRNLRNVVYGENVQSICRVCGAADETVAHFVS